MDVNRTITHDKQIPQNDVLQHRTPEVRKPHNNGWNIKSGRVFCNRKETSAHHRTEANSDSTKTSRTNFANNSKHKEYKTLSLNNVRRRLTRNKKNYTKRKNRQSLISMNRHSAKIDITRNKDSAEKNRDTVMLFMKSKRSNSHGSSSNKLLPSKCRENQHFSNADKYNNMSIFQKVVSKFPWNKSVCRICLAFNKCLGSNENNGTDCPTDPCYYRILNFPRKCKRKLCTKHSTRLFQESLEDGDKHVCFTSDLPAKKSSLILDDVKCPYCANRFTNQSTFKDEVKHDCASCLTKKEETFCPNRCMGLYQTPLKNLDKYVCDPICLPANNSMLTCEETVHSEHSSRVYEKHVVEAKEHVSVATSLSLNHKIEKPETGEYTYKSYDAMHTTSKPIEKAKLFKDATALTRCQCIDNAVNTSSKQLNTYVYKNSTQSSSVTVKETIINCCEMCECDQIKNVGVTAMCPGIKSVGCCINMKIPELTKPMKNIRAITKCQRATSSRRCCTKNAEAVTKFPGAKSSAKSSTKNVGENTRCLGATSSARCYTKNIGVITKCVGPKKDGVITKCPKANNVGVVMNCPGATSTARCCTKNIEMIKKCPRATASAKCCTKNVGAITKCPGAISSVPCGTDVKIPLNPPRCDSLFDVTRNTSNDICHICESEVRSSASCANINLPKHLVHCHCVDQAVNTSIENYTYEHKTTSVTSNQEKGIEFIRRICSKSQRNMIKTKPTPMRNKTTIETTPVCKKKISKCEKYIYKKESDEGHPLAIPLASQLVHNANSIWSFFTSHQNSSRQALRQILFAIIAITWCPCILLIYIGWCLSHPFKPTHLTRSKYRRQHLHCRNDSGATRLQALWTNFAQDMKHLSKSIITTKRRSSSPVNKNNRLFFCPFPRQHGKHPSRQIKYTTYHASLRKNAMKPVRSNRRKPNHYRKIFYNYSFNNNTKLNRNMRCSPEKSLSVHPQECRNKTVSEKYKLWKPLSNLSVYPQEKNGQARISACPSDSEEDTRQPMHRCKKCSVVISYDQREQCKNFFREIPNNHLSSVPQSIKYPHRSRPRMKYTKLVHDNAPRETKPDNLTRSNSEPKCSVPIQAQRASSDIVVCDSLDSEDHFKNKAQGETKNIESSKSKDQSDTKIIKRSHRKSVSCSCYKSDFGEFSYSIPKQDQNDIKNVKSSHTKSNLCQYIKSDLCECSDKILKLGQSDIKNVTLSHLKPIFCASSKSHLCVCFDKIKKQVQTDTKNNKLSHKKSVSCACTKSDFSDCCNKILKQDRNDIKNVKSSDPIPIFCRCIKSDLCGCSDKNLKQGQSDIKNVKLSHTKCVICACLKCDLCECSNKTVKQDHSDIKKVKPSHTKSVTCACSKSHLCVCSDNITKQVPSDIKKVKSTCTKFTKNKDQNNTANNTFSHNKLVSKSDFCECSDEISYQEQDIKNVKSSHTKSIVCIKSDICECFDKILKQSQNGVKNVHSSHTKSNRCEGIKSELCECSDKIPRQNQSDNKSKVSKQYQCGAKDIKSTNVKSVMCECSKPDIRVCVPNASKRDIATEIFKSTLHNPNNRNENKMVQSVNPCDRETEVNNTSHKTNNRVSHRRISAGDCKSRIINSRKTWHGNKLKQIRLALFEKAPHLIQPALATSVPCSPGINPKIVNCPSRSKYKLIPTKVKKSQSAARPYKICKSIPCQNPLRITKYNRLLVGVAKLTSNFHKIKCKLRLYKHKKTGRKIVTRNKSMQLSFPQPKPYQKPCPPHPKRDLRSFKLSCSFPEPFSRRPYLCPSRRQPYLPRQQQSLPRPQPSLSCLQSSHPYPQPCIRHAKQFPYHPQPCLQKPKSRRLKPSPCRPKTSPSLPKPIPRHQKSPKNRTSQCYMRRGSPYTLKTAPSTSRLKKYGEWFQNIVFCICNEVEAADKNAWKLNVSSCENLYMNVRAEKPCFWFFRHFLKCYPLFLSLHKSWSRYGRSCMFSCAFCLWCPFLLYCYICFTCCRVCCS